MAEKRIDYFDTKVCFQISIRICGMPWAKTSDAYLNSLSSPVVFPLAALCVVHRSHFAQHNAAHHRLLCYINVINYGNHQFLNNLTWFTLSANIRMRERKKKSIFVKRREINQPLKNVVLLVRVRKKTSKGLMPPLDSFEFHRAIWWAALSHINMP